MLTRAAKKIKRRPSERERYGAASGSGGSARRCGWPGGGSQREGVDAAALKAPAGELDGASCRRKLPPAA
jgi:hypothetical protein